MKEKPIAHAVNIEAGTPIDTAHFPDALDGGNVMLVYDNHVYVRGVVGKITTTEFAYDVFYSRNV